MRKNARYDKAYCEPITAFMDPGCRHSEAVPYDSKVGIRYGKKVMVAMKEVCTNCGCISPWARVTGHTVGGGFEYTVTFPEPRRKK